MFIFLFFFVLYALSGTACVWDVINLILNKQHLKKYELHFCILMIKDNNKHIPHNYMLQLLLHNLQLPLTHLFCTDQMTNIVQRRLLIV